MVEMKIFFFSVLKINGRKLDIRWKMEEKKLVLFL